MHQRKKYVLFLIVLYLFVFEFALMKIAEPFKYIDEIYALLFIPLLVLKKRQIKLSNAKIILLNLLFVVVGGVGNFLFRYQVVTAIFADALLNMKFVLGIYTTYLLFNGFDIVEYKSNVLKHVRIIVIILFILILLDYLFALFPCYEIRYGMRSEQLFFGHPTGLASVSYFLLILMFLLSSEDGVDKKLVIIGSIVLISTLRMKAIIACGIFYLLYFQIIIRKKRVSMRHALVLLPGFLMISWKQFYGYFIGTARMKMARGALFYKSFDVAKDHFPIGAGLGTFASAPSSDYYSILYEMYGLDGIYGITRESSTLVSDTFWPMILGQTGYIGLIIYILMLVEIIKKIKMGYMIDERLYFIGVAALSYLFISSISESAFVNPLSVPLSMVIGMVYLITDNKMEW